MPRCKNCRNQLRCPGVIVEPAPERCCQMLPRLHVQRCYQELSKAAVMLLRLHRKQCHPCCTDLRVRTVQVHQDLVGCRSGNADVGFPLVNLLFADCLLSMVRDYRVSMEHASASRPLVALLAAFHTGSKHAVVTCTIAPDSGPLVLPISAAQLSGDPAQRACARSKAAMNEPLFSSVPRAHKRFRRADAAAADAASRLTALVRLPAHAESSRASPAKALQAASLFEACSIRDAARTARSATCMPPWCTWDRHAGCRSGPSRTEQLDDSGVQGQPH